MAKKKRFYWLKLKDTFFNDPKIKKIRKLAGGDTYTIIMLKIMLLSIKNDGVIFFEQIEDSLPEELSLSIDEDSENVQATLIFMQKMQLIEELEDGEFLLPQVVELIGSEGDSTDRVRKYREQKKNKLLQCNADVTQCNEIVTTEKRLNIQEEDKKQKISDITKKIYKNISQEENKNESFPEFKKRIIDEYSGKKIAKGVQGYTKDVVIEISKLGYLHNTYSQKDLSRDDALEVWAWLYRNQDKLLPIKIDTK